MTTMRFPALRILVLDAADERREFFLSATGALAFGAVLEARNTEEARDQLFFNPTQLIVMGADVRPTPAARFIAETIREARTPPAVIVAGEGADAARRALLEAGAYAALDFPLSREKLIGTIAGAAAGAAAPSAPQAAHRQALRRGLI